MLIKAILMLREKLLKFMLGVAVTISTTIILWPILRSPFSGDDTFDSMIPMQLRFSGQSKWSYISSYVSNWSNNEGRFFPMAAVTGVTSHSLFTGRTEYKIVQLIVVL